MREITGTKISKLGFNSEKIGDLIYYDGPLLSLFIDSDNPYIYYLYLWVDSDETSNRWIITQVNPASLKAFLYKQTPLRDMILSNSICFCVDLGDNLTEKEVLVCSTTDLPQEYLPEQNSYYNEV